MIIRQNLGDFIYLGGTQKELEPLNFSCFNFNNNFNSDLIFLSDNFCYFVVTEQDYIKARSHNIHYNWKYSNTNGTFADRLRRTRMVKKLSILKATQELNNYKLENFITNAQNFVAHTYSLGSMEEDLGIINNQESFVSVKKAELPPEEEILPLLNA